MGKNKNKVAASLTEGLNTLLASYQAMYFNVRSSHWMIRGGNFFELHKVFETAYNEAAANIDEIAERILTLGGTPLLTGSELLKKSEIKERPSGGDETACVRLLLEDLTQLTGIEKDLVRQADDLDDIVTADLLTGYMSAQQKTVWMLSQSLNKKSSIL